MTQQPPSESTFSKLGPVEYLEQRLDVQIKWYDFKSISNQRYWRWFSCLEIVGAASIPFIAGYAGTSSKVIFAIGLIGMTVAILASFKGLFQLQENWIKYRTTCESLRKEKYLFLTQTEPYNIPDSFPLLVQRVETLVSKENTNWAQYMMNPNYQGASDG